MAGRDDAESVLLTTVRFVFRAMLRAVRTAATRASGAPDERTVEQVREVALKTWEERLPALEEAVAEAVVERASEVTGGHHLGNVDADAAAWAAEVMPLLAGEPDAVADRVGRAVADGIDAGDTPRDMRKRVAEVLDDDEWSPRIERIARTQTTAAYGFGAEVAATTVERVLGEPVERRWVATKDARTRETHRAADGQTRPVGERFTVGAASLLHPGDPAGPPEEVISCRCTTAVDFGDIDWDDVERRRQAMTASQTRGRDGTFDPKPRPLDQPIWPKRPGERRLDRTTWLDQAAALPEKVIAAAPAGRVVSVFRLAHSLSKDEALSDAARSKADGLAARIAGIHPVWAGRIINSATLPTMSQGEADALADALAADDADVDALVALLPPKLLEYWTTGEGAGKIRWGSDGDWTRCNRYLAKYTPNSEGACATLHKLTTGVWPGDRRNATADAEPCRDCGHTDTVAALTAAWADELLAAADTADYASDEDEQPGNVEAFAQMVAEVDSIVRPVIAEVAARMRLAGVDGADQFADLVATMDERASAHLHQEVYGRALANFTVERGGIEYPSPRDLVIQQAQAVAAELTRDVVQPALGDGYRLSLDLTPVEGKTVDDVIADADWKFARATVFDKGTITPAALRADLGMTDDDGEPDGGMIALAPSLSDAERIAVEGGLPAEQLHITLLYLGDADAWTTEARADLSDLLATFAGGGSFPVRLFGAAVFNPDGDNPAVVFNVGDDTGHLDAWHTAVYGMPGAGREIQQMQHSPWVAHMTSGYGTTDLTPLLELAGTEVTIDRLRLAFGGEVSDFLLDPDIEQPADPDGTDDGASIPEQVARTVPVLASADELAGLIAATIPPAALRTEVADMTTPQTAVPGDETTNARDDWRSVALEHLTMLRELIERGEGSGEDMEEFAASARGLEMVASAHTGLDFYTKPDRGLVADASIIAEAVANAPANPPLEWLKKASLPGRTPMTVNAQGRVWGHMAPFGECHEGIPGECVQAPRTSIDYAAFHRSQLATADGGMVQVGYLLAGCGHARVDMTMQEAAAYHEQSCTRVAAVRAYEDEHGIQVVGALMPGLSVEQANGITKLSGEWRAVPLEMMAAVGVDRAGYPVAPQNATELATADGGPAVLTAESGTPLPPADWVGAVADELDRRQQARVAEQARVAKRDASVAAVVAARKDAVVREHERRTRERG